MIRVLARLLGLYSVMGVLVAALFTIVPAQADDGQSEADHNADTSQQQTSATGQAATSMGVPVLDGSDHGGDQTVSSDD